MLTTSAATICANDRCSVLQVTGVVDVAHVTLDPAFDLFVPSKQVSHSTLGGAQTLDAYDSRGGLIVAFSFNVSGPYQLDIPVAPAVAQSIRLLRVSSAGATAVRQATEHGVIKSGAQ